MKNIRYRYIIEVTKYLLGQYKDNKINDLNQLVRIVKEQHPFILDFDYVFDERLWHPDKPELYNNLIEFGVHLRGYAERMTFRLLKNKGCEQEVTDVTGTVWEL